MAVVAQKRRPKTAQDYISAHAGRNEEDSSVDVHACQCRDDSTPSKKQLRANKNVGHQREEEEDDVCRLAIADVDDLEVGVASRSIHLRFTSQDSEHQDLYCRSGCVPEWSGYSIAIAYCGRL